VSLGARILILATEDTKKRHQREACKVPCSFWGGPNMSNNLSDRENATIWFDLFRL
jgi:hypothetical protein